MRRIVKLLLLLAAMVLPCSAQFIGYSSPQTVVATPLIAVDCTNSTLLSAVGAIPNLGQSFHYIQYTINTSGTLPTELRVTLLGSFAGTTSTFAISDIATDESAFSPVGQLVGFGQFPIYLIQVQCVGGTGSNIVTINYSGTSVSSSLQFSDLDRTIYHKTVFQQANTGLNRSGAGLRTPYGNTNGFLTCQYATAGVAGSTITIQDQSSASLTNSNITSFTLANVTTPQIFPVLSRPTSQIAFNYLSGGASANTFTCEMNFFKPGAQAPTFVFTHATGTTATVAKGVPGYLHTVSINTGGAGTLSVFDLPAASCTGTPSTNVVAVITSVATTLQTFTYDVNMANGICLKASAAMDYTVSSQ